MQAQISLISTSRYQEDPGHGEPCYWIDDGAHGSKNCLPFIHPFIQRDMKALI